MALQVLAKAHNTLIKSLVLGLDSSKNILALTWRLTSRVIGLTVSGLCWLKVALAVR